MKTTASAGALNELKEVISKVVPLIVGKGIKVTQRGAKAYVQIDPTTRKPAYVNIPNVSENASPEFIQSVNGFIDHECAHILFTDFEVFSSSVDRAAETGGLLSQLHNFVEDVMIERLMGEQFPGSIRNLSELRKLYLIGVTQAALKECKTPEEEFRCLAVPMVRALGGNTEMRDFMDDGNHWENPVVKHIVDNISPEGRRLIETARTTKETLIVAEELYELIKPSAPVEGSENQQDESGQSDQNGSNGSVGVASAENSEDTKKGDGSGRLAGALQADQDDEEQEGDSGKGEEGEAEGAGDDEKGEEKSEEKAEGSVSSGDESGDGSSDATDDGKQGPTSGKAEDPNTMEDMDNTGDQNGNQGVGSAPSKETMFNFDEDSLKDADYSQAIANTIQAEAIEAMDASEYNVYTTEFDLIQPPKVPSSYSAGEAGAHMTQMDNEVSQMTGRMQKDIERIMASRSMVVNIPGYRRGKLHSASLHRVLRGDDRVFTQRQENHSTETAVSLLIDNSGSMSGAKMRLAMLAGYALAKTLDRLRIAHEVIGFTTGGYSGFAIPPKVLEAMYEEAYELGITYDRAFPLVMPVYKSFEDRLDTTVKERIAFAMHKQKGLNGNVDGESLRIAVNRLHTRREKRKVVLVLSDGWPAGGPRSGKHLAAVVEQVTKEGVECVGIGIMDDAVKCYYPNNIVLNDIDELPAQVMSELKRILT